MTYAEFGQLITGITGVLLLWLAGYGVANLRYKVRGTEFFIALAVAAAVWNFGYVVEKAQTTEAGFLFAARMEYAGLSFIPSLWLLLSLSWVEHPLVRSPLFRAAVVSVGVVIGLMIWTTDWHHLYYSSITPTDRVGFAKIEHGPLYAPVVAAFSLSFIASVVLGLRRRTATAFRPRTTIILLMNAFPVAGVLAFQVGFRPGGLDMTIFSLLPTFLVMAWGTFRQELVRVVPIARELVLDAMDQAVLVLDPQGRLLDRNEAAREHAERFVAALGLDPSPQGEFRLEGVSPVPTFRFRRSPLVGLNRNQGTVVLLTDITEEKRLIDELAHQASHDALTGAYNRRHFVERGTEHTSRALREGSALALVLFDLDHFKTINDRFGHQAGDEVLKTAVSLIGGLLRPYDLLARLGGEEFAVLLPGTDADEARQAAERWRADFAGHPFVFENTAVTVTASFGAGQLVPQPEEPAADLFETLLGQADRALYRAKAEGRNRVV
jgi:diguanylate cyclase (GGDEF)-like protein